MNYTKQAYDFSASFRALYERTAKNFRTHKGEDRASYFTPNDKAFIVANGLTEQAFLDYAEDEAEYGEPGFDIAHAIELVRRYYFLTVQDGKPSPITLNPDELPAKTAILRNIPWIARIIPKARAKLRGELPPTLMYCCAGDRKFFREHNIHPAEFLVQLWHSSRNTDHILDWVQHRMSAAIAA